MGAETRTRLRGQRGHSGSAHSYRDMECLRISARLPNLAEERPNPFDGGVLRGASLYASSSQSLRMDVEIKEAVAEFGKLCGHRGKALDALA